MSIYGRSAPVESARRLVETRFPEYQAAFLAGNVVRGELTSVLGISRQIWLASVLKGN